MLLKIFLILFSLFISYSFAGSPLDDFIEAKMSEGRMPGLSVAIIKDGRIARVNGYGWADISKRIPVTPDTIFLMASVSKTFTGTALMQLYEKGQLNLDEDINRYLPFQVRNPKFKTKSITTRQLLSHVSGVRDRYAVYDRVYANGDTAIPLGDFLKDYFVPGRRFYRLANFYNFAPATGYQYSNIGSALAGYVAERISGIDFSEYCRQNIFKPLKMNQTGWFLKDVPAERLATLYDVDSNSGFVKLQHYSYPDYPNYQLRTSARQLSRFLIAHMQFGKYGNARILKPATVREMRRIQFPEIDSAQGLAFYYYYDPDGSTYLGHSGITDGTTTEMWFRVSDRVGVIMMTNRWLYTSQESRAWNDIFFRLVEEADLL
jgi:CubicO group peptidase (beta-lactamase class C family)